MKWSIPLLFLSLSIGEIGFALSTEFTGSISNDWNTTGNWTSGIPTSSYEAVIPAPKTPNLTSAGDAAYILTQPGAAPGYVLFSSSAPGILNLYPNASTAVELSGSCQFQDLVMIFNSSGSIYLGNSTSNLIGTFSKIRFNSASQSCEISGDGELIIKGDIAAESSGPFFNLGTLSLKGGSISVESPGDMGRACQNFSMTGGALTINMQCANSSNNVLISGGSITNNGAFLQSSNTVTFAGDYLSNNGFMAGSCQKITLQSGSIFNSSMLASGADLFNVENVELTVNGGQVGLLAKTFNINAGSITINNGELARQTSIITDIQGGTITILPGGSLGYLDNFLNIAGAAYLNNSGFIGSSANLFRMLSGTIYSSATSTIATNATQTQLQGSGVIILEGTSSLATNCKNLGISGANFNITCGTGCSLGQSSNYSISLCSITNYGTVGYQAGFGTFSGGSVNNYGDFALNGSSVYLTGGTISVFGSATIANNATFVQINGLNVITLKDFTIAQGAITKNIISYNLINNGTINSNQSSVTYTNQTTNNGTAADNCGTVSITNATITNGTTGNFGNNSTITIITSASISNTGTFSNNNGTIDIQGATITNGTTGNFGNNATTTLISGSTSITNTGTCFGSVTNIDISGGSITNETSGNFGNSVISATVSGGATITNTGTCFDDTANIAINSGNIINGTGGSIGINATNTDISGGALIICYGDGFNRNNSLTITAGTIDVGTVGSFGNDGTTVDISGNSNITNAGTCFDTVTNVNINGGDITNDAGGNFGNSTTSATITSGASITNDGTFFDGAGTITVSGGTIINGTSGGFGNDADKTNLSNGIIMICYGDGFNRNNSLTITDITIDVGQVGSFGNDGTTVDISGNSNITNAGTCFDTVTNVNINGGDITNDASGNFGNSTTSATITSGASITNDGTFFDGAGTITVSGGTIINGTSGSFGNDTDKTNLSNGIIMICYGDGFNRNNSLTITDITIDVGQVGSFGNDGTTVDISGNSNITNAGTCFDTVTNVNINGGDITNDASGNFGNSTTSATITSGASITNDGTFFDGAGTITVSGGTIINGTSGSFGNDTDKTNLSNGVLIICYGDGFNRNNSLTITAGTVDVGTSGNFGNSGTSVELTGNISITNSGIMFDQVIDLTVSNASIINTASGNFAPNVLSATISSGTDINNQGSCFKDNAKLVFSGGSISNTGSLGQNSTVTISNGTFNNSLSGELFTNSKTCTISGGYFDNYGQIGDGANYLKINGGVFNLQNGSKLAKSSLNFILEDIDFPVSPGASVAEGATCSLINSTVTNSSSFGTDSPSLKLFSGTIINGSNFGLNATSYMLAGYINNGSPGQLFSGPLSFVNITGGTVDNYSQCGMESYYVSIDGAAFNTYPGSFLAYNVDQFFIKNTNFINATGASLAENSTASFINSTIVSYGTACLQAPMVNIVSGQINNHSSFASTANAFMTGGSFSNKSGGTCFENSTVQITAGSIENMGDMFKSATVSLTNIGFIHNKPLSTLGYNFSANIQGGTLINDGYMGPCEINQTSGEIQNNQKLILGKLDPSFTNFIASTSTFTSGSFKGTGEVDVASLAIVSNNFTQNKIIVGWGSINPPIFQNVFGTFYADGLINANMLVTGSGSLFGSGLISGDVEVATHGYFSPGKYQDPIHNLKVKGSMILEPQSVTNIDFNLQGSDKITIYGGDLTIPGAYLYMTALQKPVPEITYILAEILPLSSSELQSGLGTITGTFTILGDQPLIDYYLFYGPQEISYQSRCLPCKSVAKTPNQYAVAKLIDILDENTNECLQSKIDDIFLMNNAQITSVLNTLEPSEMKASQISLEELIFVFNDDFSRALDSKDKKSSFSVSSAYVDLNLNSYFQYSGFNTEAGYEMIKYIHDFDHTRVGAAIGLMEINTSFKKLEAHAQSFSMAAVLGTETSFNRFLLNFDLLYSYNYLKNKRSISVFNTVAHTSHPGYSVKGEIGIAYAKENLSSKIKYYDNLIYYFGHENAYQEKGASCLGLKVNASNRQLFRNELGAYFELGQGNIKPYFDLSYVYENRFKGNSYTASFINTKPTMNVTGYIVTKNFAKFLMGVSGMQGHFKYNLKCLGQMGQRYKEGALELELGYGF